MNTAYLTIVYVLLLVEGPGASPNMKPKAPSPGDNLILGTTWNQSRHAGLVRPIIPLILHPDAARLAYFVNTVIEMSVMKLAVATKRLLGLGMEPKRAVEMDPSQSVGLRKLRRSCWKMEYEHYRLLTSVYA